MTALIKNKIRDIQRFYEKYFLLLDICISLIIFTLINYFINIYPESLTYTIRDKMYGLVISLVGTLTGFVIASLSILVTMPQNETLRKLKQSSPYHQIFKTFISTCYCFIITLLIAFVLSVLDGKERNLIFLIHLFRILIFFIVVCFSKLMRCIWILKWIIRLS